MKRSEDFIIYIRFTTSLIIIVIISTRYNITFEMLGKTIITVFSDSCGKTSYNRNTTLTPPSVLLTILREQKEILCHVRKYIFEGSEMKQQEWHPFEL